MYFLEVNSTHHYYNLQVTESGGRRYHTFHEVYKPYMRFDAVKYLIDFNKKNPEQEKDSRFLAALLLTLSGDNPTDPFKIHVVKMDFMAEIFRVRTKNDEQRFAKFRDCLSRGMVQAKESRERAKRQVMAETN